MSGSAGECPPSRGDSFNSANEECTTVQPRHVTAFVAAAAATVTAAARITETRDREQSLSNQQQQVLFINENNKMTRGEKQRCDTSSPGLGVTALSRIVDVASSDIATTFGPAATGIFGTGGPTTHTHYNQSTTTAYPPPTRIQTASGYRTHTNPSGPTGAPLYNPSVPRTTSPSVQRASSLTGAPLQHHQIGVSHSPTHHHQQQQQQHHHHHQQQQQQHHHQQHHQQQHHQLQHHQQQQHHQQHHHLSPSMHTAQQPHHQWLRTAAASPVGPGHGTYSALPPMGTGGGLAPVFSGAPSVYSPVLPPSVASHTAVGGTTMISPVQQHQQLSHHHLTSPVQSASPVHLAADGTSTAQQYRQTGYFPGGQHNASRTQGRASSANRMSFHRSSSATRGMTSLGGQYKPTTTTTTGMGSHSQFQPQQYVGSTGTMGHIAMDGTSPLGARVMETSLLGGGYTKTMSGTRLDENAVILGERIIEREVRIPKKVIVEDVVERTIIVPEKRIREEIQEETARIFEKIVEVAKPIIQETFVEVPEIEYVEKIIEVPEVVVQEKVKEVPRYEVQERIVEVPRVYTQEKIVEVPHYEYREYPVEKIVEVPEYRHQVVVREIPVPQYIEKPYTEYVTVEEEKEIARVLPIPIEVIQTFEFVLPRIRQSWKKVEVPLYVPRFVEIAIPVEMMDGITAAEAEMYAEQLTCMGVQAATSLCELETLARNVKCADFVAACSCYTPDNFVTAWRSGYLQVDGTHTLKADKPLLSKNISGASSCTREDKAEDASAAGGGYKESLSAKSDDFSECDEDAPADMVASGSCVVTVEEVLVESRSNTANNSSRPSHHTSSDESTTRKDSSRQVKPAVASSGRRTPKSVTETSQKVSRSASQKSSGDASQKVSRSASQKSSQSSVHNKRGSMEVVNHLECVKPDDQVADVTPGHNLTAASGDSTPEGDTAAAD